MEENCIRLYLVPLPPYIKGNPLCTTEDWKSFTISLLPHLSFLEIHPISAEERDKAALRYQVCT